VLVFIITHIIVKPPYCSAVRGRTQSPNGINIIHTGHLAKPQYDSTIYYKYHPRTISQETYGFERYMKKTIRRSCSGVSCLYLCQHNCSCEEIKWIL